MAEADRATWCPGCGVAVEPGTDCTACGTPVPQVPDRAGDEPRPRDARQGPRSRHVHLVGDLY